MLCTLAIVKPVEVLDGEFKLLLAGVGFNDPLARLPAEKLKAQLQPDVDTDVDTDVDMNALSIAKLPVISNEIYSEKVLSPNSKKYCQQNTLKSPINSYYFVIKISDGKTW